MAVFEMKNKMSSKQEVQGFLFCCDNYDNSCKAPP